MESTSTLSASGGRNCSWVDRYCSSVCMFHHRHFFVSRAFSDCKLTNAKPATGQHLALMIRPVPSAHVLSLSSIGRQKNSHLKFSSFKISIATTVFRRRVTIQCGCLIGGKNLDKTKLATVPRRWILEACASGRQCRRLHRKRIAQARNGRT